MVWTAIAGSVTSGPLKLAGVTTAKVETSIPAKEGQKVWHIHMRVDLQVQHQIYLYSPNVFDTESLVKVSLIKAES
jgi:hypothetical protein